jgi:hypothetical protein
VVGAGKFSQAEGVEGVGLAAGGTEARSSGLQLVGVNREHHEIRFQQTLDQDTMRALNRDALYPHPDEQLTHPVEVSLVVSEAPLQERLAVSLKHAHPVRILGPVQSPAHLSTDLLLRSLTALAERPTGSCHCGCS